MSRVVNQYPSRTQEVPIPGDRIEFDIAGLPLKKGINELEMRQINSQATTARTINPEGCDSCNRLHLTICFQKRQREEMADTEAQTLQKLERSGRDLTGISKWSFEIIAVGFVFFYIYGAGFGTSGEQYHVGMYLLLTFVLTGPVLSVQAQLTCLTPIGGGSDISWIDHRCNWILDCRI